MESVDWSILEVLTKRVLSLPGSPNIRRLPLFIVGPITAEITEVTKMRSIGLCILFLFLVFF